MLLTIALLVSSWESLSSWPPTFTLSTEKSKSLIISKTFFPLNLWQLDARGFMTTQTLCHEVMRWQQDSMLRPRRNDSDEEKDLDKWDATEDSGWGPLCLRLIGAGISKSSCCKLNIFQLPLPLIPKTSLLFSFLA